MIPVAWIVSYLYMTSIAEHAEDKIFRFVKNQKGGDLVATVTNAWLFNIILLSLRPENAR